MQIIQHNTMNNKHTLSAILLLLLSILSFSKGIDIGLQAGPTATTALGKNSIHPRADIGAATEFFVRYNFNSLVSIRTGLGFEDKGHKYKGIITDGAGNPVYESTFGHRTKYMMIPVLVEFTFGGKKVLPYVNTGLYMGFLVSAVDKYNNSNEVLIKRKVTNDYRTFDMGYLLGVGIKVPIKERWLIDVGMRNAFGFIRTNKYTSPVVSRFYNYSAAFNFGFAYKFGK